MILRGRAVPGPAAVAAAILVAAGASAAGLDDVRTRWEAGDRAAARRDLDSLLAAGAIPAANLTEAEILHARFQEEGGRYEAELRGLLGRDLPEAAEAPIHLSLGKVAYARGDLAIALEEFRRAREKGLVDEGSLWEGLTAFALGDGEAAQAALERAIEKGGPSGARALVVLGDTYRVGGRWNEARSAYRRAREAPEAESPWWPVAAFREAECLERMGETEEAHELWRELLTRRPGAYEAPLALGRLRAAQATAPAEAPDAPAGTISVQVGAFGSAENAEELAGRIRARGFAGVRVARGEDGLHRVLVGRFASRPDAEALADSLGAAFGLGYSLVDGR